MTIDSKNNFYTALLLFRSLRNGIFLPENLWEECLVLIHASSQDEAHAVAIKIGNDRELAYEAIDGSQISWEFFKVERIFEVDGSIENGTEIFSRHLRNEEVESLLRPFDA